MTDNQLASLIIQILNAGFAAQSITCNVLQNFQPVEQGGDTAASVYFHKIAERRFGFLQRKDTWLASPPQMVHTETQQCNTTFQLNARVLLDPSNVNALTAADYLDTAAGILQSDATIQTLLTNSVQILRIADERQIYGFDEKHQFESDPSFDFILCHAKTVTSIIPSTTSLVGTLSAT